jgi:acyl-CoA reductase-like NAD-dependent aldehyde dehydrogenase
VSKEQFERVTSYQEIGKKEAKVATGGGRPTAFKKGFYVEPTIFYDVDNSARIAREEIFGPVATILRFSDEAQAIRLANDSEYGLSASIWSQNVGRVNRVARALRTGTVAINTPYAVFPGLPFGGFKQSGYGRELGFETLALYSETKSVLTYIGEKPIDPFGV